MSMLDRIRTIKQIPEIPEVPKTENFKQVVKIPDLQEKTSPVQNDKNEKLIATPILPIVSKTDSNGNQYNIQSTKKYLSDNTDKKAMARAHLRTLVTAYANYYRIKTPDEFSNIKLTIYNQTYFKSDQVNVEVKYLLSDSTLYKKETMNFIKIPPLSSKEMRVPSSSMGVRIECRIISVKSRELDL